MEPTVTPDLVSTTGYLESISEDLEHVSSSLDEILQFLKDWDLIDILNLNSNKQLFNFTLFVTLLLAFLLLCHVLKR